jgi:hypothetical protein
MQHDGSNGARARSARIRASHEYEATQLDSMRRNAAALETQPPPASLRARLASAFGRPRSRRASSLNE